MSNQNESVDGPIREYRKELFEDVEKRRKSEEENGITEDVGNESVPCSDRLKTSIPSILGLVEINEII